jgi:hypothetical protein
LSDREAQYRATERALATQTKEVQAKEHKTSDPSERHGYEEERWKLEKERRTSQDMMWKIQEEVKAAEGRRLEWVERGEKFSKVINQLKSEILSL